MGIALSVSLNKYLYVSSSSCVGSESVSLCHYLNVSGPFV